LQIVIGLVISSIYVTSKCNTVGTQGIIPRDRKMIYLGCLKGHTSNPADGGILDSDTSLKQPKKKHYKSNARS